MMCAQMKAFFDATGGHWQKGALVSSNSSSSSSACVFVCIRLQAGKAAIIIMFTSTAHPE
jgi:hypothetical protein